MGVRRCHRRAYRQRYMQAYRKPYRTAYRRAYTRCHNVRVRVGKSFKSFNDQVSSIRVFGHRHGRCYRHRTCRNFCYNVPTGNEKRKKAAEKKMKERVAKQKEKVKKAESKHKES